MGFGWNAGLMYEFNANNRVGLAYHSKVDIDFEDDNAVSASRTIRGQGSAAGGLTLRLPDYLELSGSTKLQIIWHCTIATNLHTGAVSKSYTQRLMMVNLRSIKMKNIVAILVMHWCNL